MPLLPAQTFSHSSSTTSPREVTTPIPVMTTRRCIRMVGGEAVKRCSGNWRSLYRFTASPPTASLVLVFLDVIDRLADGLDLFGFFVRDGQLELVLELHDEFYGVQ